MILNVFQLIAYILLIGLLPSPQFKGILLSVSSEMPQTVVFDRFLHQRHERLSASWREYEWAKAGVSLLREDGTQLTHINSISCGDLERSAVTIRPSQGCLGGRFMARRCAWLLGWDSTSLTCQHNRTRSLMSSCAQTSPPLLNVFTGPHPQLLLSSGIYKHCLVVPRRRQTWAPETPY